MIHINAWLFCHVISAFVGLDVHSEHTFAMVLVRNSRVVTLRRMRNEHITSFLGPFNVVKAGLKA